MQPSREPQFSMKLVNCHITGMKDQWLEWAHEMMPTKGKPGAMQRVFQQLKMMKGETTKVNGACDRMENYIWKS